MTIESRIRLGYEKRDARCKSSISTRTPRQQAESSIALINLVSLQCEISRCWIWLFVQSQGKRWSMDLVLPMRVRSQIKQTALGQIHWPQSLRGRLNKPSAARRVSPSVAPGGVRKVQHGWDRRSTPVPRLLWGIVIEKGQNPLY